MKKALPVIIFILSISRVIYAQSHDISKYKADVPNGFIENKGQIVNQNYQPNPVVKYLLTTPGFNVQLRQNGFSYDTYTETITKSKDTGNSPFLRGKFKKPPDVKREYHRVDIELEGCNPNAILLPDDKSKEYFNYFTAGTPQGGVSDIRYYKKVTYKNIYPNIDLVFTVSESVADKKVPVEYCFIIHPGGNPADIKLAYKGANKVNLANNKLTINVVAGDFTENIPSSFWNDTKEHVKVDYASCGNNVFGFQISDFEANNTQSDLIIDPTPNLAWGTYYGGSGDTYGTAIALDTSDDVFLTGYTNSTNYIATVGAYISIYIGSWDVFVSKFNRSGSSLLWGTYYGGTNNDYAYSITVDRSGSAYVTGCTASGGATIATAGAYQTIHSGGTYDVFVAKFNSTGSSLLWGTYYGGSGDETGYSIVLDASDNVYITGNTNSNTGISTAGAYQTTFAGGDEIFIAKFNSTGSALVWGTYYGGNGDAVGYDILLDASNNVYITGFTENVSGMATVGAYQTIHGGGFYDAYVAKFNSTGSSLVWGTYYGGSGDDVGYSIALGANDTVYLEGSTTSSNKISTPGELQTTFSGNTNKGGIVFVAKLAPNGTSRQWGTYFDAGDQENDGSYMLIDGCGNVYLSGDTFLTGKFPGGIATNGAYETANSSGYEVGYVDKLSANGNAILWGSYFGGAGSPSEDVCGMVLDDSDNVFIGGTTSSTTDIATAGVYQTVLRGTPYSAYLANFNATNSTIILAQNKNITCYGLCDGQATVFTPCGGAAPYSYTWAPIGDTNATATGLCPGTYTCTVKDANNRTTVLTITITQPPQIRDSISAQTNANCYGESNGKLTVGVKNGFGTYTYSWSNSDSTSIITGLSAGRYTVNISDEHGCLVTASSCITQPQQLKDSISTHRNSCNNNNDGSLAVAVMGGTPAFTYSWSNSQTTNGITGLSAGWYSVTVMDSHGCSEKDSSYIAKPPAILRDSIASLTNNTCYGGNIGSLTEGVKGGWGSYSYNWSPSGGTDATATALTSGCYTVTVIDSNGCMATASACLTQPTQLALNLWNSSPLCYGSCNGTIVPLANGGVTPYTYGGTLTNLCAGTYEITVTDSNGCKDSASTTVTQPPQLNVINSVTKITCFGDSNGSAQAHVSGGSGSYTYQWIPGNSTSYMDSNLTAGTYQCIIQDNNGCYIIDTIRMTQLPKLIAQSHASPDTICAGECTRINLTTAGGISPYRYLWNTGSTVSSFPACLSNTTTFTCTISDSNKCKASSIISIKVYPLPVITISKGDSLCQGTSVQLEATGGGSYYWSPGKGLNDSTVSNPIATPLSTVQFVVMVTDSGCTAKDSVEIIVKSLTGTGITAFPSTIPYGGQSNLYVLPEVSYLWSPSTGLSCTTCQTPIATPTVTTWYYLTVIEYDGCTERDSVLVTVEAPCGEVFVPSAFSPNGDGQNDILYVRGDCIQAMQFDVYDRWGNEVFSSQNVNDGWDGTYKGNPMNTANFVYTLKALLIDGTSISQKGSISLIR